MKKIQAFWIIIAIIVIVWFANSIGQSSNSSTQSTDTAQPIVTTPSQTSQTAVQSTANNTTQPISPSISISQITLSNLVLGCSWSTGVYGTGVFPNCGQMGFTLKGEVANNSSIPFQSFYLTINAYDCPTTIVNSYCTKIGQDTSADVLVDSGVAGDEFQPSETQEAIGDAIDLGGIPPIQGNFEWTYSINQCSVKNPVFCGFFGAYDQVIQATQ